MFIRSKNTFSDTVKLISITSGILLCQNALANTPYGTNPIAIPGTIEAELFDLGGQGIAYHDLGAGNTGGQFRNEDVDIEIASTGGYNIGWFEPGEWLEYTVNVETAGNYAIHAKVASGMNGGSLRFEVYGATNTNSETISFPGTGSWQNWTSSPSTSLSLNAGTHIVRVVQNSGGFNVDSISFALTNSGGTPYHGAPAQVPGVIEAEFYDIGGAGIAYNDLNAGNTGGQLRNEDVDIELASTGGYNIGWFEPGEWLTYTINVSQAGNYDISAIVASGMGGGAMRFEFTGATDVQSADIQISDTGGWQNWTPSPNTSVTLNAGMHVVRLLQLSGGFNVNSFSLQSDTTGGNLPVAYPGYTGQYPGYTLKLDERFDTFDNSIWAKGDGAVGTESDCRFTPQGVQINNGKLELVIRNEFVPASWSNDHQSWKGDYHYSCGELRTIPAKRIKYGRIETRMKAPARAQASGYISSLFTYRHEGSPREWEEIDVELEGGRPDKFQANLIYGENAGSWSETRNWGAWEDKINIAPADQWRVYAIEWTPSAIKWYVDGVLHKTLDQSDIDCVPNCVSPQIYPTPIPDDLTELMMNFWIPNDNIQDAFGGNKANNVYPMVTEYDWVRIYQLDSQPLQNW
ncbi:carbohydrate-binding protein [Catenovulum sediminis]|uniref:Carbohydrate-binding protein n=1 Tax=Catenovulum sediminis TaxID=1740262 RepID=A0ABV1RBM8_9ALTE|nr:carbohydrate-binding protein [Catenovulum sediminis]